jgi:long-chain fatty acid transport protein
VAQGLNRLRGAILAFKQGDAMKNAKHKSRKVSLAVAAVFATGCSQAYAAAFALIEQNASGLGNAYAGAAAVAEDASTIFFNPAGMSLLPAGKQFSMGLNLIKPSAKFNDSASVASGTGLAFLAGEPTPLGGSGGDAGSLSAVPNLYYAMDLAKDWKFGIGVSSPFGLKTDYASDWEGRFQAIKSELKTVNVNPSVSWKLNDKVSLGFGANYQQIDAELSSAVNYKVATFAALGGAAGAIVPTNAAVSAANAEGTVTIKGNDNAWGYNAGAMFQLSPQSRLGVSYRSSIKYHVTGTAAFVGVPPAVATGFANSNVSLDIKMPDSFSVALVHELNEKWTLSSDLTWTGWAKIKELRILRDTGVTLSNTPENFRNTLRAGFGATYRYNENWSSKVGIAYDQTPINSIDRTPRLPDENRTWLAFGGQYRISKASAVDFGYSHLFVKNASINQNATSTPAYGLLAGTYKNSVDILGVQYRYSF